MEKIPSHRRRRGVNDTLADFICWLKTWGTMLAFLLRAPRQTVQGLRSYGLTEAFLSVPAAVDSYTGTAAGAKLRERQEEISAYIQSCFACAAAVFCPCEKAVYTEGRAAEMILHGFPGLKPVSLPTTLLLFGGENKKLPNIGICSLVCTPAAEKQAPPPVYKLKTGSGTILDCIRFIEKQTGEKFNWDAFTEHISVLSGEKSKNPAEAIELLAGRIL